MLAHNILLWNIRIFHVLIDIIELLSPDNLNVCIIQILCPRLERNTVILTEG